MTPRVLVTGITGFIGREVGRRLLTAGRPLLVLARPRDGAHAADRVAAALDVPAGDARVRVIEGDLARPLCGLDAADRRRLAASVETVIHCAGDTCFAPSRLAPYVTAHVDGPRRLLETLAAGRLRRWAHVSTAYVCGRRSGIVAESEGHVGQEFHNPYERVKLGAESALRAAGARAGVDVRVFRPSIVVGRAPSTAGGGPSNVFFEFIRMTAALADLGHGGSVPLRIEAAPYAPFNLVPVEYVAAALAALAEAPGGEGGTFHLVVRNPPAQAAVLETITARLGVRGLTLVTALDDPSRLERRVARMLRSYREYLAQHVAFDDTGARRLLGPEVRRLATLSVDTLHALIDLALGAAGATPAAGTAAARR